MSIVLYRKGDTHKEKGVLCERGLFEVEELHGKLKEGWVNDPLKLEEEKPAKKPAKRRAKKNGTSKV